MSGPPKHRLAGTSGVLMMPSFSPSGEKLGIIKTPEVPANLCFGGPDMKTIFFRPHLGLFAARQGARPPRPPLPEITLQQGAENQGRGRSGGFLHCRPGESRDPLVLLACPEPSGSLPDGGTIGCPRKPGRSP